MHALLVEHRAEVDDLRRRAVVAAAHDHRRASAVPVRQALGLDHAVRDVDPEPVDPAVEPEPQHVLEPRAHLGAVPVEVRLLGVERVQVPLAGVPGVAGQPVHAGPGRPAEDGLPVVGRLGAVRPRPGPEQVQVPLRGAGRGGQRRPEPRVLVAGVVGHQVDDHPQPQRVRPLEERVEVGERAEQRVDVAVVGDVVAAVGLRGRVERREPDGVDAEPREVVEPGGDAGQVADAVPVGVGERLGVDLVDHRVAPPRPRAGRGHLMAPWVTPDITQRWVNR